MFQQNVKQFKFKMQSCIRCTRFLHSSLLHSSYCDHLQEYLYQRYYVMPDAKVTELETQLMLISLGDL